MEKRCFTVGEQFSQSYTITGEQIDAFAKVTGDYNIVHMDGEYAKSQRFRGRVAHGLYINSLASTIMGMELPGPGTVLMDQQVIFQAPVVEGDVICITVKLSEVDERYRNYIGTLQIECKNQEEQIVLKATAHQLMPKNIFEIGGILNDES